MLVLEVKGIRELDTGDILIDKHDSKRQFEVLDIDMDTRYIHIRNLADHSNKYKVSFSKLNDIFYIDGRY